MKCRDYYFDNAKFILIFLVVMGHTIAPFTDYNHFVNSLYTWIYFFHMPAFIIISGYFAKNYKKTGHYKKMAMNLIFPYVVFEILYFLFRKLILEDNTNLDLFNPFWIMWFLISLFCWQVMLRLFEKIPFPFLFSLMISALAGYIGVFDKELSLMRTFVMFPFFLFGFSMKREHFTILKKKWLQLVSSIFLILLFLYIHFIGGISLQWLWAGNSYSTAGFKGIETPILRTFFTILMFIVSFAFLSLVSSKKRFISKLGSYTLYTYLLHGFLIRLLVYKLNWLKNPNSFLDYLIIFVFVVLICLITSSKPARFISKPILEPYNVFRILLKRWNHNTN